MSSYNTELITKRIKEFKSMDANVPKEVIFDADNTLFHFSTYGMSHEAQRNMYTRGFFKELPIFPEAPMVIENLQRLGIRCGIASNAVDSPYCIPEKKQSYAYHFPMIEEKDIHILPPGQSKAFAFDDVSNKILVDDYFVNINEWYEAGGIAIKKSYSGKQRPVPVITSLIDLFSVLKELGVY